MSNPQYMIEQIPSIWAIEEDSGIGTWSVLFLYESKELAQIALDQLELTTRGRVAYRIKPWWVNRRVNP